MIRISIKNNFVSPLRHSHLKTIRINPKCVYHHSSDGLSGKARPPHALACVQGCAASVQNGCAAGSPSGRNASDVI